MDDGLESPLAAHALAASAGVSLRQLERPIRDRFDDTPMGHHLKLRLQAARNQPFFGDLPIQEIAAARGLSSPLVLSRTIRGHFGLSPRQFRSQVSGDQLQRFHPGGPPNPAPGDGPICPPPGPRQADRQRLPTGRPRASHAAAPKTK